MPDAGTASVTTITVRLVYLARLREAFGTAGESLALAAGDATATGIVALLRARGGAWAQELAAGRAVRIAVGHELVSGDVALRDGDEVALLPPVTGG
jgi:molybdopterin synthase sulfur carrier subunit